MSSLRHVLALALVSSAVLLGGAPACSQQTEGERCDSAEAGDSDCESGLTCVSSNNLSEGLTDCCCPQAGTEKDKRCTRGTPTTGTGGSGGTSSAGGTSSGGSAVTEAGAAGTPAEASAGAGGAD